MKNNVSLPNLVISGVVKGGTTSLFTYLSNHPDICCSSVKETCYFSSYRYGQLDKRYKGAADPFKQYQSYFSHCSGQKYVMEATPGYFEGGKNLAAEMKKVLGEDTKVLVVLREPVSRLISFFKSNTGNFNLDENLSFSQYIKQCNALPQTEKVKQENDAYWGIDGGYYSKYLDEWFQCFGNSLKVVFFDDLVSDPKALLRDVSQWLEIDFSHFEKKSFGIENKSVGHRNKSLQFLARAINDRTERFWRTYPNFKKPLRELYYLVNGSTQKPDIDEHLMDELKLLYKPYNYQLFQQLSKQGYSNFPHWIKCSENVSM